jgi:hypothetical protein
MRHNTRVAGVGKKKKESGKQKRVCTLHYFHEWSFENGFILLLRDNMEVAFIHQPRFRFPAEHLLDLMGEKGHCLEDDAGTHTE